MLHTLLHLSNASLAKPRREEDDFFIGGGGEVGGKLTRALGMVWRLAWVRDLGDV